MRFGAAIIGSSGLRSGKEAAEARLAAERPGLHWIKVRRAHGATVVC